VTKQLLWLPNWRGLLPGHGEVEALYLHFSISFGTYTALPGKILPLSHFLPPGSNIRDQISGLKFQVPSLERNSETEREKDKLKLKSKKKESILLSLNPSPW